MALGLTIHFLGTGSTAPNSNRDNSSLLLVVGQRAVMIDASGYPGRKLPQLGIELDQLTDLVLTHAHIDHIYAFPSIISSKVAAAKEGGETPVLRVHGLPSVLWAAEQLLKPFIGGTASKATVQYMPLDNAEFAPVGLGLDDWSVFSFPVEHGTPAVGIVIQHASGAQVVYSGNSVADGRIAGQLNDKTLCLIQDCGAGERATPDTDTHAGAEEVRAMLKDAISPQQLVITHLTPDKDDTLQGILKSLRDGFKGRVAAAYDGMTLTF